MAQKEYDTFILKELDLVPEDQEMEMIVRELNPPDRRYKYRSLFVLAKVSKSESKYPDRLWVRLGKGQLQEKPWSIQLIKEVNKFS